MHYAHHLSRFQVNEGVYYYYPLVFGGSARIGDYIPLVDSLFKIRDGRKFYHRRCLPKDRAYHHWIRAGSRPAAYFSHVTLSFAWSFSFFFFFFSFKIQTIAQILRLQWQTETG